MDSHSAGNGLSSNSGNSFVYSGEPSFSQFRPLTSDQCTQHDVLLGAGGLRNAQTFGEQTGFAYGMEFPPDEKTECHTDEHLWLYEDPQGRVQGEFGDAQMQSWLLAGRYFTTSLRIRRKCDDTFSTLADYIKLFGRTPFVPGPRIPPLRGAITQEMIIQVRALLAIQQRALLTAANGPLDTRNQISSSVSVSTEFGPTTSAVVDSSDGDNYPKTGVPGSIAGNIQMDLKNGLTSLCGMPISGWDADSSQRQQDLPQLMLLKRLMQNLNSGGIGGGGAPLSSLAVLNAISDILAKTKPESRDPALWGATRPLPFNPTFSAPVQFADVCNGLQQSQALALAQLLSAASLNAPGCFGWPQGTHQADLAASVNQSPASVGGLPTLTPAGGIPNDEIQPATAPSVGVDPPKTAGNVGVGLQPFDPVDTSTNATVVKASGAAKQNGKSSKKASRKQLRQNGAPSASQKLDPSTVDKPLSSQSSSAATRSVSQSGSTSSQSSLWASSAEFPVDGVVTAATSGCGSSRQPLATSANNQSQVSTKSAAGNGKTRTLAANCLTEKSGAKTSGQSQGRPTKQNQTVLHPETTKAKKQTTSSSNCPNAPGSGSRKKTKAQQPETDEPAPERATPRKKASKKSGGSNPQGSGDNANSEELTALIQWVQSMLTGVELREKVDIPTFVELLTTIDAPYEVESMLLAYIGNSSRSAQFVKEFLDRRHSCWQLHRKQLETAEAKAFAKKNPSQSSGNSRTEEGSAKDSFSKTYTDNSEPQVESPWQQIKPKGGSNRKAKKAKQLS
ncbi:kinesin-like protein [Sparganum proliferum]